MSLDAVNANLTKVIDDKVTELKTGLDETIDAFKALISSQVRAASHNA